MKNTNGILLVVSMVFIAAFSRLIPHLPNFTAVGAMALFGAAFFNKKYLAILAPILALWLSDLAINNILYADYNENFVWFQSFQLYTFIPFLLVSLIGLRLFKKVTIKNIFIGSVSSALIFFVISNFGTWLSPYSLFPHNLTGLYQTYIAGLPFLRNDFLGTLVFSTILFGSYYFITKIFPSLKLKDNLNDILSA